MSSHSGVSTWTSLPLYPTTRLLRKGEVYHEAILEIGNRLRLHRSRFFIHGHHIAADTALNICKDPDLRLSAADVRKALQPTQMLSLCSVCKTTEDPLLLPYVEHQSVTREESYANDPNGILEYVPYMPPTQDPLAQTWEHAEEDRPVVQETPTTNGPFGVLNHVPRSESAFIPPLTPPLALKPLETQSQDPGAPGWAPTPTRATRRERSPSPRVIENYGAAPAGQPEDDWYEYEKDRTEHVRRLNHGQLEREKFEAMRHIARTWENLNKELPFASLSARE
jgi:hypothetical protein